MKRKVRAYIDVAGCWLTADGLAELVADAFRDIRAVNAQYGEHDATDAERKNFKATVRTKLKKIIK